MAERASFLHTAYSAYHHRDRPEEEAELTHVGPGTPCGEYLRRFWQPIITPTVCLEVMSLMTSSCVYNRDESEPRVAQ